MRVSFARPRQRSKEAFTSSRNSHSMCKHYYELVGIPIRYAATYYFRRCISVSLLRFRSREIIVCLIILICYLIYSDASEIVFQIQFVLSVSVSKFVTTVLNIIVKFIRLSQSTLGCRLSSSNVTP